MRSLPSQGHYWSWVTYGLTGIGSFECPWTRIVHCLRPQELSIALGSYKKTNAQYNKDATSIYLYVLSSKSTTDLPFGGTTLG